jgi:AcrR family transcriptional regulator
MARPTDRDARRRGLVAAAGRVFADRGVSGTAVSDIAKAAGVAQGTFYLYFASKDEVVLAVVESIGDEMMAAITDAVAASGPTAVEKLLGLSDVLIGLGEEPAIADVADFIHRRENRALHDRLAENLTPRLVPLVESIVIQGVTEAVFDVAETHAAAWFVLGGLHSIELAGTPAAQMPQAIQVVTHLTLRALGYTEAVRAEAVR